MRAAVILIVGCALFACSKAVPIPAECHPAQWDERMGGGSGACVETGLLDGVKGRITLHECCGR